LFVKQERQARARSSIRPECAKSNAEDAERAWRVEIVNLKSRIRDLKSEIFSALFRVLRAFAVSLQDGDKQKRKKTARALKPKLDFNRADFCPPVA
jgi:hypothetical protein